MLEKNSIEELIQKLIETQNEIEEKLEELYESEKQQFQYQLQRGKVIFDNAVKELHKQQKIGVFKYLSKTKLSFLLSAPIIYGMVIPIALMDLSITIYQHICFRVYNVPLVTRSDYVVIDRQHLAYLNLIEKFNCLYCGYGNGVIAYVREIFSRTEQFWCPIKHAKPHHPQHARSETFFEYGDAEAYREQLAALRKDWTKKNKRRTARVMKTTKPY